jgi:enoyl-CoA hydratase/carnithine racemase
MSHDYQDVNLTIENKIAVIEINRPEVLNAIRVKTYQDLIAAFKEADASDDVNVIVLTGANGKFTAGNDLSDLVAGDDVRQQVMDGVSGIFTTLSLVKKPVIAAVEKVAVGIGTTILLHCDMAFAGANTRFRLPFANLGVSPEGASSMLLTESVGPKIANELLLTGRFFDGSEAEKWNLINKATEDGQALETAMATAQELLKQPLASLITTKQLLNVGNAEVIEEVVTDELEAFALLLQSEETQARINYLVNSSK